MHILFWYFWGQTTAGHKEQSDNSGHKVQSDNTGQDNRGQQLQLDNTGSRQQGSTSTLDNIVSRLQGQYNKTTSGSASTNRQFVEFWDKFLKFKVDYILE